MRLQVVGVGGAVLLALVVLAVALLLTGGRRPWDRED
jgi:hypothetical protein